jgi:hypothetical protein
MSRPDITVPKRNGIAMSTKRKLPAISIRTFPSPIDKAHTDVHQRKGQGSAEGGQIADAAVRIQTLSKTENDARQHEGDGRIVPAIAPLP